MESSRRPLARCFLKYKTSDLYLAAFLKVAGIPLRETEKDGKKVIFVFEDPGGSGIKDLKEDFFMDRAKVNALSYSQSLKGLKALIHQS